MEKYRLSSWLIVHLIGGIVAATLETKFQFLGTLILAGLPIAVGQGIVLRYALRYSLVESWCWIGALALGWPIGHLIYVNSQRWSAPLIDLVNLLPFAWEVFGINVIRLSVVLGFIGLVQWLVVVRRRQPTFGTWGFGWPLLNGLAGAVLGGATATVCRIACDALAATGGTLMLSVVLGASGWGLYALVTYPYVADHP